eukprot:6331285-Prorocentrum_lima.AAC.1
MSGHKIQVGDLSDIVLAEQAAQYGFREIWMQRIKHIARTYGLPWTPEDIRLTLDLHFNARRAASGA